MLKKTMLACALVALIPAAAMAQPEGEESTGDGMGEGSSEGGGMADAPAASDAMASTGAGPAVFKKGTKGISFGLPSGGFAPAGTVNLTYFASDKIAYDLIVGLGFSHSEEVTLPGPPPVTTGGDVVSLTVGFGYRMYKNHSAKIHTYLEPAVLISEGDFSEFADQLDISVGAGLGVECMFTDWFSVRGQIGAGLSFTDKFKSIALSTGTSGLYANMYW